MQYYVEPVAIKAPRDYRNASGSIDKRELGIKFLFECSEKLSIKPLTVAAAAVFYHRFYKEVQGNCEYDEFLIAASTINLASKVKDEPVKIRDLVSVVHCTLNRTIDPPEKDQEFWLIRDAIVQAEMFITRMLKFDMNITHPHKYLIHYMKILQDWFGAEWTSTPVAKTAAGFVQDFHQSSDILLFSPSHIAICCLSLAFEIHHIRVPVRTDEDSDPEQWYLPFVGDDLNKEQHWNICNKILAMYDHKYDDVLPAAPLVVANN